MTDITTFPIPTVEFTPENFPEFVGETGDVFEPGAVLPGYLESGNTLTFVPDGEGEGEGDIEIPLDGKVYQLTITGDCNLVTGAEPEAPTVGATVVYIEIDTETPPVITTDATWNWQDAVASDIPTANNARCELILNNTPQGWVVARIIEIGVPA